MGGVINKGGSGYAVYQNMKCSIKGCSQKPSCWFGALYVCLDCYFKLRDRQREKKEVNQHGRRI